MVILLEAVDEAIKLYQTTKQKAEQENIPVAPMEFIEMIGDHDFSKWTILSLTLTAATLIAGLVILVAK
ncbi:MAG: hypothetical protein E6K97_07805 [Thaumarchaeota archaeon]|nr:MAG: hypothetical protein E6K97_07805 [Nitrososphaerota archaeon]